MDMRGEHDERERTEPDGAPTLGGSEDEAARKREACASDRTDMEPHETAECTGTELADRYNNDEDGGS
jgi:hypothetical protein